MFMQLTSPLCVLLWPRAVWSEHVEGALLCLRLALTVEDTAVC